MVYKIRFSFSFLFLNRSLLEYNCFTIICLFLLYNNVNQPYAYIYPHIPSLLRLPPTLTIPHLYVFENHLADLPMLCCFFPLANYFTFGCVYMLLLLSLHLNYPLPSHVLKSVLYVYIFIPAMPLGSSIPFFFFF